MTTDAVLTFDSTTRIYDFSIDANGDIDTEDFFDTAILYSLLGEKRALENQVILPELRRGWIGNTEDFENGSLIWLFEQERLTRDVLNRLNDEARKSLLWLVDDGFAVSIDQVESSLSNGKIIMLIVIRRSLDKVFRKSYELWNNTGGRSAT